VEELDPFRFTISERGSVDGITMDSFLYLNLCGRTAHFTSEGRVIKSLIFT
jgi:hypothetical protein